MKAIIADIRLIQEYGPKMNGIFSIPDLKNLLLEKEPVAANRRIRRLVDSGVISRFSRGFYITGDASLESLAMRMHEDSYLSCATALSRHLMIGTASARTVYAVKPGRPVTYGGSIGSLKYLGIKKELFFGFVYENDLRYATPEKALLDTLYYYQKGRRFYFNVFTDINIAGVNAGIVREYLTHYKNPRFKTFVERYLNERLS